MKKYIFFILIIIITIAGCRKTDQGADGKTSSREALSYEKRVLLDMIDILDRYSARITEATTPEDVVNATNDLCDRLDILNPEITEITTKYPEWGQNPPPLIEDVIRKYLDVNRNFTTMTLPAVKNSYIDKYPENKTLQSVYERLTKLLESEFEYR